MMISMSEGSNPEQPDGDGDGVPTGPASTPFDHPYFLPALLGGMAVWFGYDGWFNDEIEAVMFNRVGFAVLVPLFLWFTYKGKLEQEQIAAEEQNSNDPPAPIG